MIAASIIVGFSADADSLGNELGEVSAIRYLEKCNFKEVFREVVSKTRTANTNSTYKRPYNNCSLQDCH
jgi:hypothetical protein